MNFLPFALISYLLNSVSVTIDKILLTKTIPDPLIYIFYFSLLSFLALFGLPFTHIPSSEVIFFASVSTLFWNGAAYCMFTALKIGQIQRVIPVIGTVTPLFLLIIASQTNAITNNQALAIVILIIGLVFLTLKDLKGKLIKKEIFLEVLSGAFFALSYHFLRMAYLKDDFLVVLVWSRLILIPFAISFFIIPALRQRILPFFKHEKIIHKGAPLFILGQVSAGISELLLNFSIFLANPAIVNSLQGVKYVYLLLFSLILEKKYPKIYQIIGISFIGAGLYLLAFT